MKENQPEKEFKLVNSGGIDVPFERKILIENDMRPAPKMYRDKLKVEPSDLKNRDN